LHCCMCLKLIAWQWERTGETIIRCVLQINRITIGTINNNTYQNTHTPITSWEVVLYINWLNRCNLKILQFTSYKAGVGCCTHGCRRDCPSDYPTISPNYGYAPVRAYIVIPFTDKEIFEEKLLKFMRKIF